MSLRKKAFIFITIISLLLIGSVFLITRTIILNNFQELETENTRQSLDRVKSALDEKITALDTFTQDYAGWDDTYAFIKNGNQEYIDSNLVDETFSGTKIDAMIFIDNSGQIVISKMFDQDLQQALPLTNDFKQYLQPGSLLLTHENTKSIKSGFVLLKKSPMFVVSRPIITSEKNGPILGSLIMGKYISKTEVENLHHTTKLDLEIIGADTAYETLGEQIQLSTNKEYIVANSSKLISGYKVVNDINGKPGLIIKVNLPRTIYQQGQQATFYLVGSLICMSLLAGGISIIYIDKLVLIPLRRLVKDVNAIRTNADFSLQVHEEGEGELSSLARDINKMTNALASGEKALRVVNKEIAFEKTNVEKIVEERTQELKAEQARFIASINSVFEGFIMLDMHSKVVMTNHVISHIFDTEHQEWSFEKIKTYLRDSFDFDHAYKQCLLKKESITYDNIAFKDKVLKLFFAPVFLAPKTGSLTGTVVLIEDITEAKKLERSKDEFFSIASHELRTPLTAIKGNTQMMQKYFAQKISDPNFTGMLSDLYASSVRLIEIVNIFLTTSRLEQGKIEFNIEPFNSNQFLEEIVNRMQSTAQSKGLHISLQLAEVPIIVNADRNRTEEVILNLLGNAINYTEKGTITVRSKIAENMAMISVEDTGRGIAEKDQPLLFRKFQQINDTLYTRDISRGTGLGLYISRLMIEAMKGKIYIERSEVYKGSVFTFTLPLDISQAGEHI